MMADLKKRNKEGNRGGSAKKGTHGTKEVLAKKANTGNSRCSGKEVSTEDLANKEVVVAPKRVSGNTGV